MHFILLRPTNVGLFANWRQDPLPVKRLQLAFLPYLLHCSDLEPNPQYLPGTENLWSSCKSFPLYHLVWLEIAPFTKVPWQTLQRLLFSPWHLYQNGHDHSDHSECSLTVENNTYVLVRPILGAENFIKPPNF